MSYASSVSLPSSRHQYLRPPVSFDSVLFSLALLMVSFSLVMLYSTTGVTAAEQYGDPLFFVRRQAIAALLGLLGLFACLRIPLTLLRKISPYMLFVSLGLLILPMLPGIGSAAWGAQRWVSFGGMAFQPGEFVKITFVIFLAGYFSRHEAHLRTFSAGLVKPFLYVGMLGFLYLMQPDFGSTAIISLVALVMSLASGARLRHIVICGLAAIACLGLLVVMSPYRM
ncbi:MAG: FtsW/RodA/SpoVE family cell cycle protein, partial [Bdellovibrionales bacterium]|nr:FtsW/RodA/SpoVE family cell cycle protein [Bdellovibrionales bacterium]